MQAGGLFAENSEAPELPVMDNAPDEWTKKAYSPKGWSKNLVQDNILALYILQHLKDLSAKDIAELYEQFLGSPTRSKRAIRQDSAIAQLAKLLLGLSSSATSDISKVVTVHLLRYLYRKRNTPRCYEGIGCFNYEDRLGLDLGGPDPPEDVGTVMTLYGSEFDYAIQVNASVWKVKYVVNTGIELQKPLCAVIHGFNFNDNNDWMYEIKDALLKTVVLPGP
ncbi:uncharacterized protein LOC119373325 [Rhipicephalus sanguineus]|uniref:uncharacterized protein LOC119373325 n=1 Tax=Rhipicephalus sanguineus TaxID=34632 RepID=UPI0020C500A9|nr:uncharacterized protein LOC119373325 [Rhipicephalus sanguineus]